MSIRMANLCASGPVVTDGGWGTELQARGLMIGACPDAWNLSQPAAVEDVARSYVEAGSRVILTNTFGANRLALDRFGLASEMRAINLAGAEISLQAARQSAAGCRVFGTIGPTGKSLSKGEIAHKEAFAAFAEQAQVLADAGAYAIVVETMMDLQEAKLAVRAAVHTGLPVVACMVFDTLSGGGQKAFGPSPEECAVELAEAGASVIGSNCGSGAAQMLPICRRLKAAAGLPIWMKPNAGLPVFENGRAVYCATPDAFARDLLALVEAGASFVGGCCGTSPEFVRTLVMRLHG